MSDRLSAREDGTLREELIAPSAQSSARLLLDDAGRLAAARSIARADESDAAAFDVAEALRARRR